MIRSGVAALLPVLIASGTPGCAAGGGWQQMKTRRITAYAEAPSHYRETMGRLEEAYTLLSTFFPKADVGTVEVLFLDGSSIANTFGVQRGGLVLPTLPGEGRIGRGNLIVMTAEKPTTRRQVSTSTDSLDLMSHLFLHKAVPTAPLWLHEAMAKYFTRAGIQSGKGQWRACYGRATLTGDPYQKMPLDRFFRIGWKDYASSEPMYYRSTALLLMYYIFHGDEGSHRQKLPAIFAAAARGTPGPEIMAATFPGVSLEQLAHRIEELEASPMKQNVPDRSCPLPLPIEPVNIPDESSPRESPISPQEIEQVMQALKKLPHGKELPRWYPPEILRGATAAAGT